MLPYHGREKYGFTLSIEKYILFPFRFMTTFSSLELEILKDPIHSMGHSLYTN